jgi:hypothetical protein
MARWTLARSGFPAGPGIPGYVVTLVAAAASFAHFASFGISERAIVTDVRYFMYYAWQITLGAVPHVDFFENKTQLASFAGAAFVALGDVLGADPVLAMRAGYVVLAALAGLLAFLVHRTLSGGSSLAGLLGLLALCAFPLLGVLPATGPIPKLLVAVAASAAALLCYRRRWLAAGALGSLAFMDWQLGALVWLAVLVSALVSESPRREAVWRVVAGGAAGVAPFLAYYSATGALGAAYKQVVVASFQRGSDNLASGDWVDRVTRMGRVADATLPGAEWLLPFCALGLPIAVVWCWQFRSEPRLRLLLPLCVVNGGLLAFSLLDFQWYGDFFVLLHALAFFMALAWVYLYGWAQQRLKAARAPAWTLPALAGFFLIAAVSLARPFGLGPEVALATANGSADATLSDQRDVAEQVARRFRGQRVVFHDSSELLLLARITNPLPTIYWNSAAWYYYRDPGESMRASALRLLRSSDPDAFVPARILNLPAGFLREYVPLEFVSDNGHYEARFYVRRDERDERSRPRRGDRS